MLIVGIQVSPEWCSVKQHLGDYTHSYLQVTIALRPYCIFQ